MSTYNYEQRTIGNLYKVTDIKIGENGKEKFAYMGEIDYFHNMKGMVKVSVDDDHSYVKAEITVYNGTSEGYSLFFNWFFVVRDPFYAIPESVSPFIMPFLNIALFFTAEIIIYLIQQILYLLNQIFSL